jgi:hypothetical protein
MGSACFAMSVCYAKRMHSYHIVLSVPPPQVSLHGTLLALAGCSVEVGIFSALAEGLIVSFSLFAAIS